MLSQIRQMQNLKDRQEDPFLAGSYNQSSQRKSNSMNQSNALLKSIQALGKSTNKKMQILKTDKETTPKFLSSKNGRGNSSNESCFTGSNVKLQNEVVRTNPSKIDFKPNQRARLSSDSEEETVDEKITKKLNRQKDKQIHQKQGIISGKVANNSKNLSKKTNSNSNQIQDKKPEVKNVIHNIKIANHSFVPDYLRIERGQVIQWSLDTNNDTSIENDYMSMYHMAKRMHVVSFDTLNEESNPLKDQNDKFKVRFFQTGIFSYKCSIYTRMKGTIEVYDKHQTDKIPKTLELPKQTTFVEDMKNYLQDKQQFEKNSAKSRGHSLNKGSSDRSLSIYKDKSNQELSQRLIEVLDEEEDLRKSHQGDTDTPYIKKNFFKEIFESERGSMLKMHGAELSSDSENEQNKDQDEDNATDEDTFFRQQRVNSKLTNMLQTRLPLQPINESISSMSRSMSNNSSIEELQAKGYKNHKKSRRVKKQDQILEQNEDAFKSEEEQSSWNSKLELQEKEFKSPLCYDKETFERLSEFSMMFNKNTNTDVNKTKTVRDKSTSEKKLAMEKNEPLSVTDVLDHISCSEFDQSCKQKMSQFKLPDHNKTSSCQDESDYLPTKNMQLIDSKFQELNEVKPESIQIEKHIQDMKLDISAHSTSNSQNDPFDVVRGIILNAKTPLLSKINGQDDENDSKSEQEEIAALQKQRQNQKKKMRKKNKKKNAQNDNNGQTNENIRLIENFDIQVCSKLMESINQRQDYWRVNQIKSLNEIVDQTMNDEFIVNNVLEYLQDRFESKIKVAEAF